MQDTDRYRFLGHYETPRFEYGDIVFCERVGEVQIVGLRDARIPWPIGKPARARNPSIILFEALVDAVKRESSFAICYWWGVGPHTVWKWRQALGVPQATEGTSRLHADYSRTEPAVIQGRMKAVTKARDPERRRTIAEASLCGTRRSNRRWTL